MIKYVLGFMLVFSLSASRAQELVPNGDFEQYTNCPPNLSYIDYATGWQSASEGTPDFFHECGNLWQMGTPSNQFGYQYPHSGKGYAGMYFWEGSPDYISYREYIEIQLKEPLEAGKSYHFEMFLNVPNTYNYTSDQIGVYFTKTFLYQYSYGKIPAIPQLENPKGNFPDTASWRKMSGEYIATGGERFMTIGAYNDEKNIDTIDIDQSKNFKAVYFYIDDVSLSIFRPWDTVKNERQPAHDIANGKPLLHPDELPTPENCIRIPNAFSPNNDGRNDLFCPLIPCPCLSYSLKVFNRYGQEIFASNNPYEKWDGKMKGRELELGVYYYLLKVQIDYPNSKEESYKGDITLLR